MPSPPPRVDGQAVLEGVMMRTAEAYAVAVRRPTGEVVVRRRSLPAASARPWLGQLPLLRGLVAFFDGAYLGFLALLFSLVQTGADALATADVGAQAVRPPQRSQAAWWTFAVLMATTLALPLAFVVVPAAAAALCAPGWAQLAAAGQPRLAAAAALACSLSLQLISLPSYLALAASLPPLRRLCGYHGAEHKVRGAFAAGLRLSLAAVRAQPAQTADCSMHASWSFAALAALSFALLGAWLPGVPPPVVLSPAGTLVVSGAGLGLRLVALLPILAVHAELQRAWRRRRGPGVAGAADAARGPRRGAASWLAPWSPTVREPDAAMLEVALAALHALLDASAAQDARGDAASLPWRRLQGAVPATTPSARQARPRWSAPALGPATGGPLRRAEGLCCTNS